MYAIIEDSGQQIKVSEGDVIHVDPRELSDDAVSIDFERVMMVGGEDTEPRVGQPVLDGASVTGEILDEGRGEKVEIYKYRRRKHEQKRRGHRQPYITVRITGISA